MLNIDNFTDLLWKVLGQFPDGRFPYKHFSEDISLTDSSLKDSSPKDSSPNGQFSEQTFLQISPIFLFVGIQKYPKLMNSNKKYIE